MTANPDNHPGVSTTIVGWTAGPAKPPAYDKEGTKGVLEISIPVNEGYKKYGEFVKTGTTWYTYSGASDFAQSVLSPLQKGTKVRIEDANQEVREYQDREGNTKLGITLRYGNLTVLEQPSGASDEPVF